MVRISLRFTVFASMLAASFPNKQGWERSKYLSLLFPNLPSKLSFFMFPGSKQ